MADIATNNMFGIDWGAEVKNSLGDLKESAKKYSNSGKAPKGPLPIGIFPASVQEAKAETYSTGSKGVTFTYIFTEGEVKNRIVKERITLVKADGSRTQNGHRNLTQRLIAFGVTEAQLSVFKMPKNEHDFGDLKLTLGSPIKVNIKEDKPYEGRPGRAVKGVYPGLE